MTRFGPPGAARAVLRLALPPWARDDVLADLEVIWGERRRARGRRSADIWYWMQAFASLGPSVTARWRRARGRTAREPRVGEDSTRRAVHEGPAHRAGGEQGMMESARRDVTFALAQLRRRPTVGVVVVTTLAIGIGATTAIFSAVNGVLLRGLPYEDQGDLVMVTSRMGGTSLPRFVSGPDLLDVSTSTTTIEELAAFRETTVGPMTRVDRPEHIVTTPVTWNLFELLGVDASWGRTFTRSDADPVEPGDTLPPPSAAVISHDFWVRSFGADPDVLGRIVHVWGGAHEIVGVLPADFRMVVPPELNIPPDGDIWRVIRLDYGQWSREWRSLRVIARLQAGMGLPAAQADLDRIAGDLRNLHPHHTDERTELRVHGVHAAVAAPLRPLLWVLMGAVTLVLLIACANVANLLLARGAERASEMALRSSLGAGRGRLVRQLLTESAVLAAIGAVCGTLLALIGVRLLQLFRPEDLHRLEAVRLDTPVLVFAVALAAVATLLSGLLPAWHATRGGAASRLGVRGGTGVARRSRDALVVGEVALSLVLLVGAGLLIRTFASLQGMPLGFEPQHVLTVTATQSSRPREERRAYEAELIEAARSVPGVAEAGIVFPLPMNGVYDRSAEYAMDGREHEPTAWTTAYFRTVSPSYFSTMGLELRRGRPFVETDENYDVPIVVLDELLADRAFGSTDPVGSTLWVRGMEGDTLEAEIVGVVEWSPQRDHRDRRPTMYFPRIFYQSHEVSLVAKLADAAPSVGARLSEAVRAVDPGFPADLVPMDEYVRERLEGARFLSTLMQIFGGIALGLSAIGIYGVLAYAVRQRRRELGLRFALGAQPGAVTGSVVLGGVRLALVGVALGALGARLMGQALRSQLFGVGPGDPATIGVAIAVVLSVAAAASVVPALRAARVTPLVALREE